MKRWLPLLLILKTALVLGWAASPPSRAPAVLLNTSASLPVGLYRRVSSEPARGSLVAACLAPEWARLARERRYVSSGRLCPAKTAPVLKAIAAAAGDAVSYEDGALSVNGLVLPSSSVLVSDTQGRPMPLGRAFPYGLAAGEVLLLAPEPHSFDGRYLGPVQTGSVLGVYRPWLVLSDR